MIWKKKKQKEEITKANKEVEALKNKMEKVKKEKEEISKLIEEERKKNSRKILPPKTVKPKASDSSSDGVGNSKAYTPSSSETSQSTTSQGISSRQQQGEAIHPLIGEKPKVTQTNISVYNSGNGFFSLSVNGGYGDLLAEIDEKKEFYIIRPDLSKMPLEEYFKEFWENVKPDFIKKVKESILKNNKEESIKKTEKLGNSKQTKIESAKEFYRVKGINLIIDEARE